MKREKCTHIHILTEKQCTNDAIYKLIFDNYESAEKLTFLYTDFIYRCQKHISENKEVVYNSLYIKTEHYNFYLRTEYIGYDREISEFIKKSSVFIDNLKENNKVDLLVQKVYLSNDLNENQTRNRLKIRDDLMNNLKSIFYRDFLAYPKNYSLNDFQSILNIDYFEKVCLDTIKEIELNNLTKL